MSGGTQSRGPNQKTIILFVVGAAALVVILALIIFSLAFGGKGGSTAPLVSLAQQQTEMARIAKLANDSNQLSSQDARNFSRTTQLTLTSDKAELVSFLARNGKKLNTKQLGAKQSAATDSALSAAGASGTYDSTLTGILQTQLKTYQSNLTQAYNGASSASEKALLKTEFTNATLLLEQSSQRN